MMVAPLEQINWQEKANKISGRALFFSLSGRVERRRSFVSDLYFVVSCRSKRESTRANSSALYSFVSLAGAGLLDNFWLDSPPAVRDRSEPCYRYVQYYSTYLLPLSCAAFNSIIMKRTVTKHF